MTTPSPCHMHLTGSTVVHAGIIGNDTPSCMTGNKKRRGTARITTDPITCRRCLSMRGAATTPCDRQRTPAEQPARDITHIGHHTMTVRCTRCKQTFASDHGESTAFDNHDCPNMPKRREGESVTDWLARIRANDAATTTTTR